MQRSSRIASRATLHAACLLLYLTLLPATASAQSDVQLRLYAGVFNTAAWLDDTGEETDAREFGIEMNWSPIADWRLSPLIGTAANEDDAAWFYSGLRWGHSLAARWRTAFSLAVALYEEGDSKVLGSDLEFRSGIELAYVMLGGHAFGAQFYHISNAGISETNPGVNSLVFFYSMPLRPN